MMVMITSAELNKYTASHETVYRFYRWTNESHENALSIFGKPWELENWHSEYTMDHDHYVRN